MRRVSFLKPAAHGQFFFFFFFFSFFFFFRVHKITLSDVENNEEGTAEVGWYPTERCLPRGPPGALTQPRGCGRAEGGDSDDPISSSHP